MNQLVITVVFAAVVLSASAAIVPLNKAPWLSSFTFSLGQKCLAVAISDQFSLTSAECVYNAKLTELNYTTIFGATHKVSKVFIHPKWSNGSIENNIAVIKLKQSSLLNSFNIDSIALPQDNAWRSHQSNSIVVNGWRMVDDDIFDNVTLKKSELSLSSKSHCQSTYGMLNYDKLLCVDSSKNAGVCQGDSGGPMTVTVDGKHVLVGLTSFGPASGCVNDQPRVFTNINTYLDWIQKKIMLH